MSLKGIMNVSGMSGLQKVIAPTKNGYIAESLADKKRFAVTADHRVSMLDDITVFTKGEDVKLKDIFLAMKKMEEKDIVIDAKADDKSIKEAFKKIVPDYDEDRVYVSDMKKIFKWYQLVKDVVDKEDEKEENENNDVPSADNTAASTGEKKEDS